jgi:hypothetical protein
VGTPTLPVQRGAIPHAYDISRTYFRAEEDFPGPRTMSAAAEWIRSSAPAHEQFFLFVDEFDPHEPFDTPSPYAEMYDRDWDGPRVIWPPYLIDVVGSGQLSPRTARQIRANYGPSSRQSITGSDIWWPPSTKRG